MRIKFIKPVSPYLPGDFATFNYPKGVVFAQTCVDQGYAVNADDKKADDNASKTPKAG